MKDIAYFVDAHAVLHRAHHAPMGELHAPDGTPTKALYLFTKLIMKLAREHKPTWLAVVFDQPRHTLHRRAWYPPYKAGRPRTDTGLRTQIGLARQLMSELGVAVVDAPRYEADDCLATLVDAVDGTPTVLVALDKDLHQTLRPRVRMYDPYTNTYTTKEQAEARWGVGVGRMAYVQALAGDSSDGIPGVPGVGPRTATTLIQKYHTLEGVVRHAKELTPAKRAGVMGTDLDLMYRLTRLDTNAPLVVRGDLVFGGLRTGASARKTFKRLGFSRWAGGT